MIMQSEGFDLVVIGSGPAGQKAAIAASKLGRSVALVDRGARLGGETVHSAVPSKTLRESVLILHRVPPALLLPSLRRSAVAGRVVEPAVGSQRAPDAESDLVV
jgi:NADPH-dependent 2,4-dienoyl-CoA reductase/sulfur reductase-like enzyme